MSGYFPELKSSGRRAKVELDLSNYAEADLKNEKGADTSKLTKKFNLASLNSNIDKLDIDKSKNIPTNLSNLESKVDKLDVDKLVPAPADLSKGSDIVKNVVKKDVYIALIKNIEDKIPDITNSATNTTLNAKINEIKNKIPSINNLATTVALITVENKIPNVTDKVTKTDYDAKISEMEKNILLVLMIISSQAIYLMQR